MSLPREIGTQTGSLVTVGIRKNAPWANAAPRGMSYTKHSISPMEQQRDGERIYIGISAGNWKQRWYSHRHSFSNPKLRYQTALSKYFWGLKDQGLSPQIKWKILRHSSAANSFNGRCNLCLDEKISIINFKNRKLLLNKRNELVFKCRHRGKFKLS